MKKNLILSVLALILLTMNVLADADINDDGKIDLSDLILVTTYFGQTTGYDSEADSDNNGLIDIYDVVYVASRVGTTPPCTPTTEICGNGIDEDCDGYDLACSGRSLYVSTTGSDSYDGLYPTYQGGTKGPYLTVQKALTASIDGDTIYIATGTYDLAGYSTSLTKAISLIGQSRDNTILTNGGTLLLHKKVDAKNIKFTNFAKQDYNSAVFKLAPAAGEVIEDMTIDSCAFDNVPSAVLSRNYAGTMRNIAITNNIMTNINSPWSTHAILIRDGTISDIIVSDNTIKNIYSTSSTADVIAIYFGKDEGTNVDRVTVSENVIETIRGGTTLSPTNYTPGGRGILLYGTNIKVLNNYVSDIDYPATGLPRNCIYIKASDSTIAGNVVHNCGAGTGGSGDLTIKGEGNTGNIVIGNKVTGDYAGIGLYMKGEVNITNNYVKKPAGGTGIYAYELTGRLININNNHIETKDRSISVHDAAGGGIMNNAIISYASSTISLSNSPNVIVQGNVECQGNSCSNIIPPYPTCQNLGHVCCESCSGTAYSAYDTNCEDEGIGKCCAICS